MEENQDSLSELFPRIPGDDIRALQKFWGANGPPRLGLGRKPAVIVVDMVEGFLRDEFASARSSAAQPCVREIKILLAAARSRDWPIIYTTTMPLKHVAEIGARWAANGGPGSFPWTEGDHHDVVAELRPAEDDIVLSKPKPSAFFGTQLDAILRDLDVDTVVVTGMSTSGCVRATVNDAFHRAFRVVVPAECVADRSSLSHEVELFDMYAKYADVMRLSELLGEMNCKP